MIAQCPRCAQSSNYMHFGADGVLEPLEAVRIPLVPVTHHMDRHSPIFFSSSSRAIGAWLCPIPWKDLI